MAKQKKIIENQLIIVMSKIINRLSKCYTARCSPLLYPLGHMMFKYEDHRNIAEVDRYINIYIYILWGGGRWIIVVSFFFLLEAVLQLENRKSTHKGIKR